MSQFDHLPKPAGRLLPDNIHLPKPAPKACARKGCHKKCSSCRPRRRAQRRGRRWEQIVLIHRFPWHHSNWQVFGVGAAHLEGKEPPYLADFLRNTGPRSTSGCFLPTTVPGILANLEALKASQGNRCDMFCVHTQRPKAKGLLGGKQRSRCGIIPACEQAKIARRTLGTGTAPPAAG